MKKNKPVEVTVNETVKTVSGEEVTVQEVLIGKKVIGEIEAQANSKFKVTGFDNFYAMTKSLDDALEELIKHWNLNN